MPQKNESDRVLSLAREIFTGLIIQPCAVGWVTETIAEKSIENAKAFWSVWDQQKPEKPNG